MDSAFGAPSLCARIVIGAVIIKHMLNIDDREVVAQIQENMYLQYFVGFSSLTTEEPFDASLMVSIRYRLGQDVMEEFNRLVLQHLPPGWCLELGTCCTGCNGLSIKFGTLLLINQYAVNKLPSG